MLGDWLLGLWSMVSSGSHGNWPCTVALSPLPPTIPTPQPPYPRLQIKMQENNGGNEKVTIVLAKRAGHPLCNLYSVYSLVGQKRLLLVVSSTATPRRAPAAAPGKESGLTQVKCKSQSFTGFH